MARGKNQHRLIRSQSNMVLGSWLQIRKPHLTSDFEDVAAKRLSLIRIAENTRDVRKNSIIGMRALNEPDYARLGSWVTRSVWSCSGNKGFSFGSLNVKFIRYSPISITSLLRNRQDCTLRPLTKIPLVLLRSRIIQPSTSRARSAW